MNLGRLVQDHVLVEPQVSRYFYNQGNTHGRDRGHDVNVVRTKNIGQFFTGLGHELDAHVHGDEQGERQLIVERCHR